MAHATATILHADLDAFYASVEQMLNPALRGKPIAVGGGVVLAASYEAKSFGVNSGMSGRRARELCPHLIFVSGHFHDYRRLGDAAIDVLNDFTPLVERISIDEAFADVAGCTHLFASPAEIAGAVRHRVRTELGLAISVGVARTKHLAKIASQVAKPDGLVVVDPDAELGFLHDLPVGLMWGVGPVTQARLADAGIATIGELATMPGWSLERIVGRAGREKLTALAWNRDPRDIRPRQRAQSAGAQSALGRKSDLLVAVSDAVESVSDEEADRWAAHADLTEAMRSAINTVLESARTKDKSIQTFEDVVPYLIRHPEDDAYFVDLLTRSGYLTVWQLNTERNRWQYEDALLAELPREECENYCKGTLKDEEAGPHRYVINRSSFRGLSHQYKLASFKLLFDQYDLLAGEHRKRVMVARRWLEENGLVEPAIDVVLRPHSPEWFSAMDQWDPVKAAMTRFVVGKAGRDDVCSVCGDDPASDYRLEKALRPAGGPDTLRLCDDCVGIRRNMGEHFEAI